MRSMLQEFFLMAQVLAGSGKPSFSESCRLLITSVVEIYPESFSRSDASVTPDRGLRLYQKKTSNIKNHREKFEAKIQNVRTTTCTNPTLNLWLRTSGCTIQVHVGFRPQQLNYSYFELNHLISLFIWLLGPKSVVFVSVEKKNRHSSAWCEFSFQFVQTEY